MIRIIPERLHLYFSAIKYKLLNCFMISYWLWVDTNPLSEFSPKTIILKVAKVCCWLHIRAYRRVTSGILMQMADWWARKIHSRLSLMYRMQIPSLLSSSLWRGMIVNQISYSIPNVDPLAKFIPLSLRLSSPALLMPYRIWLAGQL